VASRYPHMADLTLAPPSPPREKAGDAGLVGAARGGLGNLVGAGVAGAAGLGVTWLAARGLGPAAAGSFFAATSAFVLFSTIARLGTSTALVYWPARLRAQGRPELIGQCLRIGLFPVAILATMLAVTLWFVAPHWFPLSLTVFLPIAALAESLLAATRGYRMMRPTVLLDKIVKPGTQLLGIGVLAGLALIVGAHTPPALWTLAWALPYLPVFICAAILTWRKTHTSTFPVLSPRGGQGLGSAFWRFTAPRAIASGAQTALQRVDVLLVASLAGLVPAAAYAVAGRFIVVGQLANGAISQAVQPRLAEMLAIDNRAGANRLYQMATAWLVLISWPLHLLILVYADFYLSVFGPSYVPAASAVRVLAAAMLIATGCGMVDIVLSMAGRTSWNLLNVLLALAVMVGIDLYAIPRLGALGAAIGLAAAVLTNNLLPLAQLGFSLRLHPFGPPTRYAMALALLSFGLVPWLTRPVSALAGPLVGLTVYALGLRLLHSRLELALVVEGMSRRWRSGAR
jgi:O-antigen/teichoic acid export membrane protein